MTDVLLLGGTGWLSSRIAEHWLDAGARVTCAARGGRDAPAGARLVVADRDGADPYAALADREWDEIVDVSSSARHVASAVAALGPATRHWTYISSVSVYADDDRPGADESAAPAEPAEGDDDDYARQKSGAEAAVRRGLGRRAAIIRPGLIAGPGDPSDRFGYWVSRFALAAAGPVLVPCAADALVQVIDVDDLAAFAVALGRERWTGAVNAVGDPHPFASVIADAREAAGHTGTVVTAPDAWLTAHEVAHWAGPRSLPLWLPADMPGFMSRSNAAFRILGGRLRPLRTTLERTLADERVRGLDRPRRAGLTRADELALLRELP